MQTKQNIGEGKKRRVGTPPFYQILLSLMAFPLVTTIPLSTNLHFSLYFQITYVKDHVVWFYLCVTYFSCHISTIYTVFQITIYYSDSILKIYFALIILFLAHLGQKRSDTRDLELTIAWYECLEPNLCSLGVEQRGVPAESSPALLHTL